MKKLLPFACMAVVSCQSQPGPPIPKAEAFYSADVRKYQVEIYTYSGVWEVPVPPGALVTLRKDKYTSLIGQFSYANKRWNLDEIHSANWNRSCHFWVNFDPVKKLFGKHYSTGGDCPEGYAASQVTEARHELFARFTEVDQPRYLERVISGKVHTGHVIVVTAAPEQSQDAPNR